MGPWTIDEDESAKGCGLEYVGSHVQTQRDYVTE